MVENDQDEVVRIQERIAGLEHDTDDLKKALRYNLPKGLWMPVDRRNVLEILLMQDKITNQTKDIIASRIGWPVSTTHSIIGAVVGFAAVEGVH